MSERREKAMREYHRTMYERPETFVFDDQKAAEYPPEPDEDLGAPQGEPPK